MNKCSGPGCTCEACLTIPGRSHVTIMLSVPGEMPACLGYIDINTDPFLVEDWMIRKVTETAVRQLTKYVVNNTGKVIN